MKTETRMIDSFEKVGFKDFGTLILTQGEQESLTIEADEELIDELISEVRDGTLVLGVDDDWFRRIGKLFSSLLASKECKVTYYLTCKNLSKISVSGQCRLECDALRAENLKLNISGMGNLHFGDLTCEQLDVNISGRGEFSAAGQVNHQQIRISGSADYDAPDLISQVGRVIISGQGNVTLQAQEDLNVTISGLGEVNYIGRPKIRQVISGMGKIKKIDYQDPSDDHEEGPQNDQRDQNREESVGNYSA